VAGKSVLPHRHQAASQKTELRWVYGDTGVKEMEGMTGADGDTGVMEMDGVVGSIYLGDPCVAGKSVFCHYRHTAWQRTERRWVYGDTGMTEMDWATGANRYTGMMNTDFVMGGVQR